MSTNLESGENSLMVHDDENPELRWFFIRKVYSIITFQLLLTIPVISVVLFVHPVTHFFDSKQGTIVYIVLIFVPLQAITFHGKYPHNYFLLLLINVSSALPIGLTCVFIGGKISLKVVILITMMMFILTLYTSWAGKRSHDLSILRSILYGSLSLFILFSLIQIMFPLGIPSAKLLLSRMSGCFVSIIFYGYIVHGTESLISCKKFTYDQHITAFLAMYLCVIIAFFIPLVILIGF
ncbi:protein LIFEGUARD [Trifolium repens]|nr:protein LIFEGUARD [Trifolium repens]